MNALLAQSGLPRYDGLDPKTLGPDIDRLIAEAQAVLEAVVAPETPATWAAVMAPLTTATEALGRTWSAVHHMGGVMDSPDWRDLTNSKLEVVTAFWSHLAQDRRLFQKMKALASAADVLADPTRQQALSNSLRDFRLGGAELSAKDQDTFARQTARLAQLSQVFSEHLLDSTNASVVHVSDAEQLEGIPAHAVAAAAEEARRRELTGHVFTLQQPSLMPVLQFARHRPLREAIYRKHATRESEIAQEGPANDNTPIMGEILSLRQRQARLLGFESAAQMSLVSKMASTPDEVIGFLAALASKARPSAQADLADLRGFARETLGLETLEGWDIAYASEQLRQARYLFSEDEVRQYFPLPAVLDGLFGVVHTLFGVSIEAMSTDDPSPAWHPDVEAFLVKRGGESIGHLYLDLYSRSTKRGGAWMDDARGRRRLGQALQTPVALLTCNFAAPAPASGRPSTLTHDDVITLFHEFGHGLHHLLTQVDDLEVSGINGVEWDAVELPSQFMENFCWEWETLQAMTRHQETNAALPRELFEKMKAAKNFQSGLFMLRQIEFSLFDIRIHSEIEATADQSPEEVGRDIDAILQSVRKEVAVIVPPAFNRFAQGFGHIFAGGYAAGYYSYKWAEVLSADAYAAFEEAGPTAYSDVGQRFLNEVLSRGGSRPALVSFESFRGRVPSIDPLLRHNGLAQAA